jgi:hypothetical protein
VGLAAEMASSGCSGCICVPFEHSKLRIAALNHEPVSRAVGDPTADFAPEFLWRTAAGQFRNVRFIVVPDETVVTMRVEVLKHGQVDWIFLDLLKKVQVVENQVKDLI